jgi:NADH-quinone oxidoreductase subunit N
MNTLLSISAFSILSLASELFGFRKQAVWLVFGGLLLSLGLCVAEWGSSASYYSNMLVMDNPGRAFSAVILGIAALLVLLSGRFFQTYEVNRSESYALMLFSLAGAVAMLNFGNLVMLFLGVELLSIPMYVLAGSDKQNLLSNEAALKYFMMGAFASGFLLFGIAMVYGATGSFDLYQIGAFAAEGMAKGGLPSLFLAGIVMLIIAMAFKVSAAPLHFWAPDVYDGSPSLVTMFMATVVKIAAFGAFMKLFSVAFGPAAASFAAVLGVLAVLTMTVGNFSAIYQQSFKRMMAYSGVAHAGYLLLGLLVATVQAGSAVLFYGVGYAVATVSAFTVMLLVYYATDSENVTAFKGLGKKQPLLATVMTIALLSLAGIPGTAGFFGKYYLFSLTIQKGYMFLAVIGILNSLVSVVYYLRTIITMYADAPDNDTPLEIPLTYKIVLAITTLTTLALGIVPGLLMELLG